MTSLSLDIQYIHCASGFVFVFFVGFLTNMKLAVLCVTIIMMAYSFHNFVLETLIQTTELGQPLLVCSAADTLVTVYQTK